MVRSATKVTKDLLAAAPKLRIIGRAGSGVDNIDMPSASGKGVLVVNAPGANSIAVAEQALALMLSLARSVPAADQAMKKEELGEEEVHGHRAAQQGARHRGARPHRSRGRAAREVVRHDDCRLRPVPSRRRLPPRSASS
ncbi:MAG: hypothetical protein QM736_13725 [Vicinamibacterales bacterium]